VSFFVRPLGGIILGAYADRAGRKGALLACTSLMMVGTSLIAMTPSCATTGVYASIIVISARLIQGFSAGGVFGSATALLAEQSPENRAFYSSWQFASQGLTTAMASSFGVALSLFLTPQEIAGRGWRIPFFFGLLKVPPHFMYDDMWS